MLQPTVDEMARRGTPFAGLLYAGLALTARGAAGHRVQRPVRRPGDPGRAGPAAHARSAGCCTPRRPGGWPRSARCEWSDDAAVTVVVAAQGYPEAPRAGGVVSGLDAAASVPGATVLHAGTGRTARRPGRQQRRPGAVGGRHRARPGRGPRRRRTPRSTGSGSRQPPPHRHRRGRGRRREGRLMSEREVLTWDGFGAAGT